MSQDIQRQAITKKPLVYQPSGIEAVPNQQDVEYLLTDTGISLTADIYRPLNAGNGASLPAVIFVLGYSDVGFQRIFGCRQKDMVSYISWAQLMATSGLMAITYTTKEPTTDIDALLQYLRQNAAELGIDAGRIGLWACSGNVPNALSVLMRHDSGYLKCAVLCYGFMLDLDGITNVAEAASQWGFANPCTGKSVNDFPQNLPLFIVRAGLDETPHLNETIDSFLTSALRRNLPITFVNHATAPHAFDLTDDSETSREIIRQILTFTRHYLERVDQATP